MTNDQESWKVRCLDRVSPSCFPFPGFPLTIYNFQFTIYNSNKPLLFCLTITRTSRNQKDLNHEEHKGHEGFFVFFFSAASAVNFLPENGKTLRLGSSLSYEL
jgi:hypothetical protein